MFSFKRAIALFCLLLPAVGAVSLNLFIVLDKSLSIGLVDEHCQQVSQRPCWPLAVSLARNLTTYFELQAGGVANGVTDKRGLCVSIMTVSCFNGDPITKYLTYTGCSTSINEMEGAFYRMERLMDPHGGTCPSAALETCGRIIQNISAFRPVSFVALMTDKDISPTDVDKTNAAIKSLQNIPGTTFQSIPIGSQWYANEGSVVINRIRSSYNLTFENLQVVHGQNSGTNPPQAPEVTSPGLSDGAIAGIVIGVVVVAGIAFVRFRKSDLDYDNLI